MNQKLKLYGIIAFLFLMIPHFAEIKGQPMADSPDRPPNIIFVLIDDLGYTDVNPYAPHAETFYETPTISRLAEQGMKFTNAYTNAANCAPTRAALMSGQYYPIKPIYTANSGARGDAEDRKLIPAPNETTLPLEKITFAERLKETGYATGFMGNGTWGVHHMQAPSSRDLI